MANRLRITPVSTRVPMLRAIGALGLVLAGFVSNPAYGTDSVAVETLKTHSRIFFNIDENIPTQFKTSNKGFELLIKGIGLIDLGISFEQERMWREKLARLNDPRLSSVQFAETPEGLRVVGQWRFPSGKAALAHPQMESFDYRERSDQHRYVIDFWLKDGPTLAQVQAQKKADRQVAALKQNEEEIRRQNEARLARQKMKAEQEDATRFCREPLANDTDVFLNFYAYHEKLDFSRWLPVTTPDTQFPYFEPKGKDQEAQYVRLALSLYRQGRPGLTVRTLDFLDTEYPRSQFRLEMRFLRANALIKLGLNAEAEGILNRLLAEAKDSSVGLYTGMYLAAKRVEKGEYLGSLESFLWLINHYPNHRLSWVFHLGAAECLAALKQTARAAKEYQWVAENGTSDRIKSEGAFRIGDLYLNRFQHDQALATYYQSLKYFTAQAPEYPVVYINRAEALYGLAQYDRAAEAYLEFLEKYPAHPAGWRATYRLGEIHGRSPAGRQNAKKWFLETINRYPLSPGATLARLHLLPCDDHAGFSFEAAEHFLSGEARRFDGRGEMPLEKYPALRGLAYVRTLVAFKRLDRAMDVAIREMETPGNVEAHLVFGKMIGMLFRKNVLALLDAGKKYEALAFYSEKSGHLARDTGLADPDHFLRLSQAAAELGLANLASELVAQYERASTQQNKQGDGRTVASSAQPSNVQLASGDIEERLRVSNEQFTRAKALWIMSATHEGIPAESAQKIRKHLEQVSDESPFSYEKELLLGLLAEKEKEYPSALAHAIRAQMLQPASGKPNRDLRVDHWLALLQAKAGDPAVAYEQYRNLELAIAAQKKGDVEVDSSDPAALLGVAPVPTHEAVVIAQAELLEKLHRWGDVAATYARAMKEGWGGDRASYGYAHALLAQGKDRDKAISVLQKLAEGKAPKPAEGKSNDFWKKLAMETLANEQSKTDLANPRSGAKEGKK